MRLESHSISMPGSASDKTAAQMLADFRHSGVAKTRPLKLSPIGSGPAVPCTIALTIAVQDMRSSGSPSNPMVNKIFFFALHLIIGRVTGLAEREMRKWNRNAQPDRQTDMPTEMFAGAPVSRLLTTERRAHFTGGSISVSQNG